MTPADMKALALNLRRWAASVRFPGDGFFREDLLDAALFLEERASPVTSTHQTTEAK